MPLNTGSVNNALGTNKKDEDKGLLAGIAGNIGSKIINNASPIGMASKALGRGDLVSEEDLKANVRGVTDMLNPATLAPAIAHAGIGQARALSGIPLALATGGNYKKMEESPLSFLADTENMKKQQALMDQGGTNAVMGAVGSVTPVGQDLANAVAATGIRGGGALASGISQTGLFGQRLTPNQMVEQHGGSVESYGQANEKGGAGAMLLGDLLNVAPALKGAAFEGAANPLAGTAAGRGIADVGAALEQAPLAPVSIPGKGFMEAVNKAEAGATAFPKLANVPVVGNAAEGVGQFFGEKQAGFNQRAQIMGEQARINMEAAPQINELTSAIETANLAGDEALSESLHGQLNTLQNSLKREATVAALPKITARGEELAQKYGGETVKTDPFSRVIDDVTGAYSGPGKFNVIEGLPKFQHEAMGQGVLGNAESVLREVPENYTEKLIDAHLKGLNSPALPKDPNLARAVQNFDKGMNAWKTSVLPFRPAWHVGNAVGNAMGAMLLGEVSPIWFAKNAPDLIREFKGLKNVNPENVWAQPALGRGIGAEAPKFNLKEGLSLKEVAKKGDVREIGKRASNASYAGAQGVDDFTHYIVAKFHKERNLASGMSKEAAEQAANATSLKVAGDFGNMSVAERAGLRRVMPFYPWYKHQAKATLRFPIENPARFLQSQALAQRVAPGQGMNEAPGGEFLNNQLKLGSGQYMRVPGDIGLGLENNPLLNPAKLGGGLNPIFQGAGAAAGFNLGRGRMLDESPGQNIGSRVGGYLINASGAPRTAADLVDTLKGEGDLVRGDTRQIKVSGGRPIANAKSGGPLLPFLTGASLQEPDLKSMSKRAKSTEKVAKGKEKSYNKAVKKSAK